MSSWAKMSSTRELSEMVGEMKISAWLSADARDDQHSPMRRFLALRADFEGKPQDDLTRSGMTSPCCLNSALSSSVALESHCSRVMVLVILNAFRWLMTESFSRLSLYKHNRIVPVFLDR